MCNCQPVLVQNDAMVLKLNPACPQHGNNIKSGPLLSAASFSVLLQMGDGSEPGVTLFDWLDTLEEIRRYYGQRGSWETWKSR